MNSIRNRKLLCSSMRI